MAGHNSVHENSVHKTRPGPLSPSSVYESEGAAAQKVSRLAAVTAIAVAVACAATFANLVDSVREGDDFARYDTALAVFLAGHRTALGTLCFALLSQIGRERNIALLAVAVAGLIAWKTRRLRGVWTTACAFALTEATIYTIKAMVERHRPGAAFSAAPAHGYSFPSGHATISLVIFAVLAWQATRLNNRHLRRTIWPIAITLAVAVGASRVYLGVHYLSDIIASWTLAIGILATLFAAIKAIQQSHPSAGRLQAPSGAGQHRRRVAGGT
jgi:membrane-associated phospholipid phosphatase